MNRKTPTQPIVDAESAAPSVERPKLLPDGARAERDLLRNLFDVMPQLGWTARPDGFIDYYNRGWYEFTGSSREAMLGWGWTSVHQPDAVEAVLAQWKRSIATGEPFESTFQLRRHDGVYRWFLTRVHPMRDEDGRIVRWVGINTDVDDQKQAEAAAVAAIRDVESEGRRRVADTERVRQHVLAVVSHELRNPLSTIQMAAKQVELLARERELGTRLERPAILILRAVDRMTRLVGDLLDLSKLQAGQPLPLEVDQYDITQLIRDAVEDLEPVARAKHLGLTADAAEPAYVTCDRNRVQQVLSNLVGNSMKFTREGGAISVRARAMLEEVVVSVTDSGIGMSELQLPHIFEAYWQSDPRRSGGAGLGLGIVKAIVDSHGGRIWAESTVGVGSTFYFTLPTAGRQLRTEDDDG
jgi:PAS domain S-box-containing protein